MRPLVLVIEDESILAESISFYLDHHGYDTAVAKCGEDGLRLAEQANPDVAVVDVRLPGIDGLEVLERLRELSPATKVVMTTAHASLTCMEAKRRGAFGYLNKPFDLEALRLVIEAAIAQLRLGRSGRSATPAVASGLS